MENHDKKNDGADTVTDLTPTTSKTQKNKQRNKRHTQSQKTENKEEDTHRKSFRRSWRSSGPVAKLTVVFAGIAAAAGVAYVAVLVQQTRLAKWAVQVEHAPNVIISQPPQLLEPLICDPKSGFRTGRMRFFIKNVGTARAINTFPMGGVIRIIPETKTGDEIFDNPPKADCNVKINATDVTYNVAPGQEFQTEAVQSAGTLPKGLREDSRVQAYLVSCVYYSDEYKTNHTTCDTYRLMVQSGVLPDLFNDNPVFLCDALPKIGKFSGAVTGHCQD